jgi:YegS/Rv2252/BmrU family lipid kinase
MEQKIFFIVNPYSANGWTGRKWPGIKERFEAELGPIDFALTRGSNHASYLVAQALYEGYEKIIVVGGDGTLNEAVNGFYEDGRRINGGAVLGYLPSGTGEDFSLTLGIDDHQLSDHVRRLLGGEPRPVDIGEAAFRKWDGTAATRKFINESSLGFSAAVALRVNNSSKLLGGRAAFFLGVLRTLTFLKSNPVRIEIDGDEYYNGRALIVALCNGRYFGGGMMIAPRAEVDDGQLEIVIVKEMGRLELLANIGSVYKGTHLANPKVICARGREINISSEQGLWIEMDGELVGLTGASYRLLDKEIGVIV